MKNKLLLLFTLTGALFSLPAWALHDMKLVIEPGIADSDDPIKISVTNSSCYSNAEVFSSLPLHNSIEIRLSYALHGDYEQCLEERPDAPDFETTIEPLTAGEYGVVARTHTGGFVFSTVDTKFLSVIEAPPAARLSQGGINGLYNRPDSPHQYVYVLETDYTTLVVWNTFDADGNQLWVYGVGDQLNDGQSVVAETYINRGRGFLPGGELEVEAEPWGLIRVDLTSCLEGAVTYRSDLPEFDSGRFSIVRLAYSKQIGCADSG